MKTTVITIEYLVAGILILVSCALLIDICPNGGGFADCLYDNVKTAETYKWVILATLSSLAYLLGIIAESFTRLLFDIHLNMICKTRYDNLKSNFNFTRYMITGNRATIRTIFNIIRESIPDNGVTSGFWSRFFGSRFYHISDFLDYLRFFVKKNDTNLYEEITSHINRLRLLRMLFVPAYILSFVFPLDRFFIFLDPKTPDVIFSETFYCSILASFFLCLLYLLIRDRNKRYCDSVIRAFFISF